MTLPAFSEFFVENFTDSRRVKFVPSSDDIMEPPKNSKPLSADQHYAVKRAREGASNETIASEMEITLKAVQHHHAYAREKGWYVPAQKPGANKYPNLDSRLHKILDGERGRERLDTSTIHERIKSIYPKIGARTIERRVRILRKERQQNELRAENSTTA